MAGVSFNGRYINHPGAYDSIDAAKLAVTNAPGSIPVVIGQANAGQSGVLQWFTSADAVQNTLKGGDLVTATQLMFSPSPEGGGGASIVGVIVANPTTQASYIAGGGAYTLTAKEYGVGGNNISVKQEAGSLGVGAAGTQTYPGSKVTLFRWDTNQTEVYDNVGLLFSIQYTGTDAFAVVTVANNTLSLYTGATSTSATVKFSVDLTNPQYSTVGALVQYLQSISAANNITVASVTSNSLSLPVSTLDQIGSNVTPYTGLDVKTSLNYITAKTADLNNQISTWSNLVNVTVDQTKAFPTNFVATYLSGGSAGVVPTDWSPFLTLLNSEFSDILVLLTSNSTIHAQGLAHVASMEQRNQKQLLFVGGALGETPQQAVVRAQNLNSSRAILAYPGIYYQDKNTSLAPYFTAAMLAGRVAGVDPSEPITFDYFNLIGLYHKMVAGDPDINYLISNGVATLEYAGSQGIRLVQGITTYTGQDNDLYREISVRRGADNLSENMRLAMEQTFVGKKGTPPTIASVTVKAIDVLEDALRNGEINGYRNVQVTFVGSVITINYEVAPVEPINFILITSHFVPNPSVTTTVGNPGTGVFTPGTQLGS